MKRINNLNINKIEVESLSELATKKFKAKNLSVTLDESLHTKLKTVAFINNTSMGEITRALLEQFVAQFNSKNVETIHDNPAPKTETF